MFDRWITAKINQSLAENPAVALLGPRQVGKTTLAHSFTEAGALYLDLESPRDRAMLSDPEGYLERHRDTLVVLDEVQRMPRLFEPLRGLIDRARREAARGKPGDADMANGRYLLLGSASLDLVQQSSETLAGRLDFIELAGLHRLEVPQALWGDLWLRGGFPLSLTARSLQGSLNWRSAFIRTYLERDMAQFAPRMATDPMRRLWVMLAHLQGSYVNVADLSRNLSMDVRTVQSYLDLLVDLLLVRRLPSWHGHTGKRLVKSPKYYIRDSGLVHSLLGIRDMDSLLSHPVVGASWEGHVIENLLAVAPTHLQASTYRTGAGAEIDLVLSSPSGQQTAIEIKRSATPKPARGFYTACDDLQAAQRWLIGDVKASYPLEGSIEVMPIEHAMQRIAAL
jgi:uncharacterized protein